jgi:hypothetical protein
MRVYAYISGMLDVLQRTGVQREFVMFASITEAILASCQLQPSHYTHQPGARTETLEQHVPDDLI